MAMNVKKFKSKLKSLIGLIDTKLHEKLDDKGNTLYNSYDMSIDIDLDTYNRYKNYHYMEYLLIEAEAYFDALGYDCTHTDTQLTISFNYSNAIKYLVKRKLTPINLNSSIPELREIIAKSYKM